MFLYLSNSLILGYAQPLIFLDVDLRTVTFSQRICIQLELLIWH